MFLQREIKIILVTFLTTWSACWRRWGTGGMTHWTEVWPQLLSWLQTLGEGGDDSEYWCSTAWCLWTKTLKPSQSGQLQGPRASLRQGGRGRLDVKGGGVGAQVRYPTAMPCWNLDFKSIRWSYFRAIKLNYFKDHFLFPPHLNFSKNSEYRAATFPAAARIPAWRKIRKSFFGLAKFANCLFRLDEILICVGPA